MAQREGHRHFESHIFFDGAVKDRNPTDFVLKLVSLIPSTLGKNFNKTFINSSIRIYSVGVGVRGGVSYVRSSNMFYVKVFI